MNERIEIPEDHELYVEPVPMRRRDTAGVILALLALSVIGLVGYVYMTPGMSFGKLFGGDRPAAVAVATPDQSSKDAAATATEARCPYCGMYASRSMGHVIAGWSDGSEAHFDSWDCAFNFGTENSLSITGAKVIDHGSSLDQPRWLEAQSAVYLYDTKRVEGSMPPFTAAFPDNASAQAAQGELGGELLDFTALAAKWSVTLMELKPAGANSDSEAGGPASDDGAAPTPSVDENSDSASSDGKDADAAPEKAAGIAHSEHADGSELACPYCGMLATNSGTHVAAAWADGSHHHYDCFDCMFQHARENSAGISEVQVSRYGTSPGEVDWLSAGSAVFLYDTKRIKGSMPTYVAAFASKADAEAAQAELGGEIVDWPELQSRWEQQ